MALKSTLLPFLPIIKNDYQLLPQVIEIAASTALLLGSRLCCIELLVSEIEEALRLG